MPEPPGDVGRLVLYHRHIHPGHGAEERRAHLRRQLLAAVLLAAEPDRLGDPRPVEPGSVAGPVGQLMEEGCVVGLGGGENLQWRHRDRVALREVGRLARNHPGSVPGDHILAGGDRLHVAGDLHGDPLALREVEDLVVAHQRPLPLQDHRDLVAVLAHRPPDLVERPEDHDPGGLLALPDVAAEVLDLVVGAPPGVAGEQDPVDPAVGPAGGKVHRAHALPGLPPGHRAGLEGGEDPVPDHLIHRHHASGLPLVAARRADIRIDHRVGTGRSPEVLPLPVHPAVLSPDDGTAAVAGGRYHSSPLRRGTSAARWSHS